jgi:hypothetical protein
VTLWLLADEIGRDCFAMNSSSRQIVLGRTPLPRAKHLFQIGYGDGLMGNAQLLRRYGYDVTSACGNRAAQFVLCMRAPYDLFVIDHSSAERERLEMEGWISAWYPSTRLVVLRQPLAEGCGQLLASRSTAAHAESDATAAPLERPSAYL